MTAVPVQRRTGPAADFWERSLTGWHLTWYAVLAVCALGAQVAPAGGGGASRRLVSAGAALYLAVLYTVAGRRLLGRRAGSARATAYVVAVLVGLLAYQWGAGASITVALVFVLFPQTWSMAARRTAATLVVVVVGALALQAADASGWTAAGVRDAVLTFTVQSAVSLVLGLWVTGIVDESEARADLLAQLERTRADLATTQHARGVLAERERVAREIHDTLAQGFTSVVALAQAADAALERGRPQDLLLARDQLALVEATARENLTEARAIVAAHQPPDLAGDHLVGALRRVLERFGAQSGVRTHLTVDACAPRLRPQVEVVLLRAAQEALSNVARHAGARSVQVSLATDGGSVELEVRDDGRGPSTGSSPAGSRGGGYGLAGMGARVRELGGAVALDEAAGGGAVLRVTLPLPAGTVTAP